MQLLSDRLWNGSIRLWVHCSACVKTAWAKVESDIVAALVEVPTKMVAKMISRRELFIVLYSPATTTWWRCCLLMLVVASVVLRQGPQVIRIFVQDLRKSRFESVTNATLYPRRGTYPPSTHNTRVSHEWDHSALEANQSHFSQSQDRC